MSDRVSFDQAISALKDLALPLGKVRVPLADASGRVLAETVRAGINAPRQDVSMMDGYAVRSADIVDVPFSLPISAEYFAGHADTVPLVAGSCARVFTGAPVPEGADRVIVQENVKRKGDIATVISAAGPAEHIRRTASDFELGAAMVEEGASIDWRTMAAIGAADHGDVLVYERPRLVIISSGDELVAPGMAADRAGVIPDSLSNAIGAFAETRGADIRCVLRIADDEARLADAVRAAQLDADLIIMIGGASVGDRDLSRRAFGGALDYAFEKVALKPGKPTWLAKSGETSVLGLPGNPVSALVTARLFLAPLISGLCGAKPQDELRFTPAQLQGPLPATGDRETFFRGQTVVDTGGVTPLAVQDSAGQKSLPIADTLIRRPPNATALDSGEAVSVLPFS